MNFIPYFLGLNFVVVFYAIVSKNIYICSGMTTLDILIRLLLMMSETLVFETLGHLLYLHNSGGTPLGTYKKLIEFYKAGDISFKYIKTFNMDEYCGKYRYLRLSQNK